MLINNKWYPDPPIYKVRFIDRGYDTNITKRIGWEVRWLSTELNQKFMYFHEIEAARKFHTILLLLEEPIQ